LSFRGESEALEPQPKSASLISAGNLDNANDFGIPGAELSDRKARSLDLKVFTLFWRNDGLVIRQS
jgi:hypothetical protein